MHDHGAGAGALQGRQVPRMADVGQVRKPGLFQARHAVQQTGSMRQLGPGNLRHREDVVRPCLGEEPRMADVGGSHCRLLCLPKYNRMFDRRLQQTAGVAG